MSNDNALAHESRYQNQLHRLSHNIRAKGCVNLPVRPGSARRQEPLPYEQRCAGQMIDERQDKSMTPDTHCSESESEEGEKAMTLSPSFQCVVTRED